MINSNLSLKIVPVNQIEINPYDERRARDLMSDEEYQDFIQSIKEHGILTPIKLVAVNKHYEVIDGDRRLRVAKHLGEQEVVAIVETRDVSEEKHRLDSYIANVFRKDLEDMERAYSIRDIYKAAGYSIAQVRIGINFIRNNFYDPRKKTPEEFMNSIVNKNETIKASTLPVDKKFIETCNSISESPSRQYFLLRLITNMDEKVLEYTEKIGLSTQKKVMLAHKKLQEHPLLQKQLARDIQHKDPMTAKYKVAQTVRDLETGHIQKTKKGDYSMGITRPENIRRKEQENAASLFVLMTGGIIKDLIEKFIDKKIAGAVKYEPQLIKQSKKRMIEIVKQSAEREIITLEDEMKMLRDLSTQMLDVLDAEFDSRSKKKELVKP